MKRVCAMKRRRKIDPVPEIDSDNKRTTLLDLPDICLDKILLPMSLKELAVVANSNEHLKNRAICVYKLNKFPDNLNTRDHSQTGHDDFASILEAFGAHFKMIGIDSNDNQKIIDALIEHCGQSLTNLNVTLTKDTKKNIVISRPFVNLKYLHYSIIDSKCDKFWFTKINQWFPMLESLALSIQQPNPQIQNLLAYNMKYLRYFNLCSYTLTCDKFNLSKFVSANPQLFRIYLSKIETGNTFAKTWGKSSNISFLTISAMNGKLSLRCLMELKELRSLDISAGICYTHLNSLQLPKLNRLGIKLVGNVNTISKFITKCHSLTQLHIDLNQNPFSLSDKVRISPNISILSLRNGTSLALRGVMNLTNPWSLDISAEDYPDIQHVDLPNLKRFRIKLTNNLESIIMFIEKCRNLMFLTLDFDNNLSLSSSHIESLKETLMNLNCLNTIICQRIEDRNLVKSLQSIPNKRHQLVNV